MPTAKTRPTTPNADDIERVLQRDPEVRRLTRRVLRAQAELRRVLHDQEWRAFLAVEELTVERNTVALAVVAKWAFTRCVKKRGVRRRAGS